jgi:hypothetical protein
MIFEGINHGDQVDNCRFVLPLSYISHYCRPHDGLQGTVVYYLSYVYQPLACRAAGAKWHRPSKALVPNIYCLTPDMHSEAEIRPASLKQGTATELNKGRGGVWGAGAFHQAVQLLSGTETCMVYYSYYSSDLLWPHCRELAVEAYLRIEQGCELCCQRFAYNVQGLRYTPCIAGVQCGSSSTKCFDSYSRRCDQISRMGLVVVRRTV